VLDDTLLDDPSRIADTDTAGYLRAAALAGAQVRSVVAAAQEAGIERMAADRPRALVLVTRPGVGAAAARLISALLTTACPVPVVIADAVPSWVGALDFVIAHSDDPGDVVLAESLDRATRYGARVVVTAPSEGPVAAAAAGRGMLLPARVAVPTGLGFARALGAGLVVVGALGLLRTDMRALADEMDREAERCHPMHESFMNPAKGLALRMADRTPLLWGLDPAATAVAWHAAFVLASHASVVSDVADYRQALGRAALHRAAVRSCSGGDLFADPDDDEQPTQPRVLLLTVSHSDVAEAARRSTEATMPGADMILLADEVSGGEAVCAAVLALRFELAALYLGLAAGTIGGSGYFAPTAV
jgi:hypothetical protein